MEGNVCICVPPICDARSGDRQDPTRSSVRADTDRSQMAQSVLVRQTIGASDRLSFGPPLRKDLLSQPHNHQRHQSLQAVCLHAWRLSIDLCKRKDFLERQPNRSLADTDNPHELSMIASGGSSLVGVVTDRWIHARSLS